MDVEVELMALHLSLFLSNLILILHNVRVLYIQPQGYQVVSYFHSERWMTKQERAFTEWLNFVLKQRGDFENVRFEFLNPHGS